MYGKEKQYIREKIWHVGNFVKLILTFNLELIDFNPHKNKLSGQDMSESLILLN